jgi:ABC-type proline/glycine betaine transport system permease subunit
MQRKRADRYDYGFSALGVLLSYLFLLFAQGQEWSATLTIISFVAFSVLVGLPLGLLKSRLQSRRRNFR